MQKTNPFKPDVIASAPVSRHTSYVLDRFLANQHEIQQVYPGCSLVLATNESDFVPRLNEQINLYQLRAEVLVYKTERPWFARSRAWNIAIGRNVLREHMLSCGAEYFLSLDADMVYDPQIVNILKKKIQGFDVVFSGYPFFPYGSWQFSLGCALINRETIGKINFKCYEFLNGQVFYEDELFYMDLFPLRVRVNRGLFFSITHYHDNGYFTVEPGHVGWFRTLTNTPLARYLVTRTSLLFKRHLFKWLRVLAEKAQKTEMKG